jgi:hypothetical protein
MKARAAIHPALASGVLCVAGCPAKKIIGFVPVDTSGTRSTPEECAPPASNSGPRLSVYLAAVGRRTPSGMRSDCRRVEVESQTHFALRN